MIAFPLTFNWLLCGNVQGIFGRYLCSNKRPWWRHKCHHVFLYLSLYLSFLSFFLAYTLIVLRLTGYSQTVIEMSCGAWGGVACCGNLVFGILTHMHNLTWYTLCVLHCSNGKCVYVCVSVWAQYPTCVAIEWSYGLCPVSILLLLQASEC